MFVLKPIISMAATTTNTCLISSLPSLKTISFKPTTASTKLSNLSCTFSQKKVVKLFVTRAATEFNWGSDSAVEESGDSFNRNVEPSEEAKIYVGNLSYDVDSDSLDELFQQAGSVDKSEVIFDRETGRSRGFAFVTMTNVEDVEKAVEMFSGYELEGRQLTVNKASPRGARPERTERAPRGGAFDGSSRIYVGNLPWSADDESLEQAFSEYGKVVSARVVSDRETGRSRGFGFVVMSSEAETKDAIANLDGQEMDGRSINVNVAQDKPRQPRRY